MLDYKFCWTKLEILALRFPWPTSGV